MVWYDGNEFLEFEDFYICLSKNYFAFSFKLYKYYGSFFGVGSDFTIEAVYIQFCESR